MITCVQKYGTVPADRTSTDDDNKLIRDTNTKLRQKRNSDERVDHTLSRHSHGTTAT